MEYLVEYPGENTLEIISEIEDNKGNPGVKK